jgi:nucleotide-binding universal stress UspA family protein
MYPIRRIMVGLDMTEMDDQLIAHLPLLESMFTPDIIYFVHVAKSLQLPQRLKEKYPGLMAPVDESLEHDILKKIHATYTPSEGIKLKVEVKEGNEIKEILNWSDVKEIDLFVMGRKLDLKGEGRLPNRLAHVAHCSILFIPEKATPSLNKILVPVDFSNTSALALAFGMAIKKHVPCQIYLQNSYEVPSGYHLTGKTYEEFREIMKNNAMDDAEEFIRKHKVKKEEVSIILSFDDEDDPSERAYEEARKENIDLIIIASRGRTGIASILLGSVAEKMIRYNSDIPLLIAKNKKENLGFFQALLRI